MCETIETGLSIADGAMVIRGRMQDKLRSAASKDVVRSDQIRIDTTHPSIRYNIIRIDVVVVDVVIEDELEVSQDRDQEVHMDLEPPFAT